MTGLYLISSVALTYMIVSMALFFVHLIKEEHASFNSGKAKCFVFVVGFLISLTSLACAFSITINILDYTSDENKSFVLYNKSKLLFWAM